MDPKNKACENCDAEIAISENECPKCHVKFDELEEVIVSVTTAQNVIEKRKAKEAPPVPTPEPAATPASRLRGLGNAIRRGRQ